MNWSNTKILLLSFFLLSYQVICFAQNKENFGQICRGKIVDKTSGTGIEKAQISLLNYTPTKTALTDENGEFLVNAIPLGHQRFRISADGFYETIISEIVVSGKELILLISLDEEITKPLIIVESDRIPPSNKKKGKPFYVKNIKAEAVDNMNTISTRRFDIDEVTKYVGGISDPARIITNFPGLFNIDDTQNYIVSRGNSPYGIGWLIEGIPIDNPHHFATLSNTGAIFPLLNSNLLSNSDFANGAMAAHYNDAYSGIFDLKLRNGNNQKYEFAAQLSLYGAELVAEGPFKKGGASFAVAYRYGIFSLLQLLQIDIGSNASPQYQDLNFKISIPTEKAGSFSIFGIGGLSNIDILEANRDSSDIFAERNINLYVRSNTGIIGVTHKKYFNRNNYIKTTLSYDIRDYHSSRDTITSDDTTIDYYAADEVVQNFRLASHINSKINAKMAFRGGVFFALQKVKIDDGIIYQDLKQELADELLVKTGGYSEIKYKPSDKLSIVAGVTGYYWSMNKNSWAIEPRFNINWNFHPKHKISFGYGWHSKTAPMASLYYIKKMPDDSYNNSNRNLGLIRSHHAVLSYDFSIRRNWLFKTNIYTQLNTNIPISQTASSYSITNYGAFAIFPRETDLKNEGLGLNYGIEVGLEKFFSRGYYGLLGFTYSRALYQGSDMVWRNSAFDVLYVGQFVAGKEFKIGRKKANIFYIDVRYNAHGGQPYTPILLEESKLAQQEVRDLENAYSQRLNSYNRIDVRVGFKFNNRYRKISHHFYIEGLNVAGFRNDLDISYNIDTQKIVKSKQFGFIPMFFYQLRF